MALPITVNVAASAAATTAVVPAQAATAGSGGDVSFAAALEAQLGVIQPCPQPSLAAEPASPDGDTRVAGNVTSKDAKSKDEPALDPTTAAMLTVPVAAASVVSPPAAPRPADIEPPGAAADTTRDTASLRATLPGAGSALPEQTSKRMQGSSGADFGADNPSQAPASIAAPVQRLPVALAAINGNAPADDNKLPADDKLPSAGKPVPGTSHVAAAAARASDPQPEAAPPLQPAHMANTVSAPAHGDQPSIPGSVGDDRWGDALSERVVWMVGQKVSTAEFRVEPPQLGPITVRLSMSNDQANLLFNAPHALAREAIQTSLPRLQEMLQQSGVALGNVFVGQGNRQGQGSSMFADMRPERSGDVSGAPVIASGALSVRRGVGLVDLFA